MYLPKKEHHDIPTVSCLALYGTKMTSSIFDQSQSEFPFTIDCQTLFIDSSWPTYLNHVSVDHCDVASSSLQRDNEWCPGHDVNLHPHFHCSSFGSILYWCVMRPASQRFFIHSCIYLRILIISYLTTFLGTNRLSVLMCRKAVNQSISLLFICSSNHV